MDVLVPNRTRPWTPLGLWMCWSQIAPDHGRHSVLAMDVLVPNRTRPWTSLGFGHGCAGPKSHKTMDVITFPKALSLLSHENTDRREVFGDEHDGMP